MLGGVSSSSADWGPSLSGRRGLWLGSREWRQRSCSKRSGAGKKLGVVSRERKRERRTTSPDISGGNWDIDLLGTLLNCEYWNVVEMGKLGMELNGVHEHHPTRVFVRLARLEGFALYNCYAVYRLFRRTAPPLALEHCFHWRKGRFELHLHAWSCIRSDFQARCVCIYLSVEFAFCVKETH